MNKSNYQAGVVYCNTVKMTDRVYNILNDMFPEKVAEHHSRMNREEQEENDLMFLNGERQIMVATSASYMKIDHSDIDMVIHFNLPQSPTDYYQQAGRAGQFGQAAKCVLLYTENDYIMNRLAALDQMKEYANSSVCLTQQLLSSLGETMDTPCGKCSNCQKGRSHMK